MKNRIKMNKKPANEVKKNKRTWKDPEFEIYSLLDKDLYIRAGATDCDECGPCECGDPCS